MNFFQNIFIKCCVLLHGYLSVGMATCTGTKSQTTGNQDTCLVTTFMQNQPNRRMPWWRLVPRRKIACIGIFDGHGDTGREIAQLAAMTAERTIEQNLSDGVCELHKVLRAAMKEIGKVLDRSELSLRGGTTGSIALVRGSMVVMAFVGDSSIGLWGKKKSEADDGTYLKCFSRNHHLDSLKERRRVERTGAVIDGPYIVDEETEEGLAMTRSFGDRAFRRYGCISQANLIEMKMERGDTLVVASDGLWDDPKISMEGVEESVKKYRCDPQQLACALLKQTEGRGTPWDDTTVACLTRL